MNPYLLFADDDADDLEMIIGYFRQYESRATVLDFEDGSEVLRFLNGIPENQPMPALVVLDMNMPRLTGKETLIQMRQHPRFKKIPVIIYSTSSGKSEEAFCAEYLATWVHKPSNIEQVKEVARTIADFCRQYKTC